MNFVVILFVAIAVLTFGMIGVHLIKIFDLVSKGIPIIATLKFLMYTVPVALSMTIPFGILVAVMLVFGRMSADNEITALRACGVSILQIIAPILLLTFLLTCVCVMLQVDIGPKYFGEARKLVTKVGIDQPLAILEPGRAVNFDNIYIYIGERVGENEITDIQIFRMSRDHTMIEQDITATNGKIVVDRAKQILTICLDNTSIISYDKKNQVPLRTHLENFEFPINYGEAFNKRRLSKRAKYLSFRELFGRTVLYNRMPDKFFAKLGKNRQQEVTRLEIEINERLALSLSPIAFLLLGLPLAIRTSRRETSIGLFLSVVLAGIYFLSVIIFKTFDSHPEYHPEMLLWIPNILYQLVGSLFIYRIARR